MMGLVIMCAPALGPTLSGMIVESVGWQAIFWVCLPLLIFVYVYGLYYMQNVSVITKPRIDAISIVLSTIGFGGIVFGFSQAGEGAGAWGEPGVLVPIGLGVVGLILFVIRQMRMDKPMLNLRVFKFPMFTVGVLLVFLCMMLILSAAILLPMFLKGGLLLTTFAAGFMMLPGGIINGLMSPITGRLFDRFGPKYLVIPGFALTTIFLYLLSNVTTEVSQIGIIALHSCLFIGVAMIMMPAQTNGLNVLPKHFYPDGAAIMNTLQQIAGAIGTAIAVSMMAAGQSAYMKTAADPAALDTGAQALTAGVQQGFMFALIASVIGLIVALFIRRVRVG